MMPSSQRSWLVLELGQWRRRAARSRHVVTVRSRRLVLGDDTNTLDAPGPCNPRDQTRPLILRSSPSLPVDILDVPREPPAGVLFSDECQSTPWTGFLTVVVVCLLHHQHNHLQPTTVVCMLRELGVMGGGGGC